MQSINKSVIVETQEKHQLLNLTSEVLKAVESSGIRSGFAGIYSQHTTASVFVSECQQALSHDVMEFFRQIVQEGLPYRHNSPEFSDCDRKNAAAHLRSLLLGQSVFLPIADGKPVLGQFQSIMLVEFDGPRQRCLHLQVLGE